MELEEFKQQVEPIASAQILPFVRLTEVTDGSPSALAGTKLLKYRIVD